MPRNGRSPEVLKLAFIYLAMAVAAGWPWATWWPLAARIGLAAFYSIAAVTTMTLGGLV